MERNLTVLHMSDLQMGRNNRFKTDEELEHFLNATVDDVRDVSSQHGLQIDVVLCTGDLAEWALPSEFSVSFDFLKRLANHIGVSRDRVVVVPGNHDVNRKLCEHARQQSEMENRPFKAPYFEKMQYFKTAYEDFYDSRAYSSGLWDIHVFEELGVLVIALGSCYAESELDTDHYGDLGPTQLTQAIEAAKARDPNRRLLWMATLHHSLERVGLDDESRLRDADVLVATCQGNGIRLLFHGHQHLAGSQLMGSPSSPPLYVFASGSSSLVGDAMPEVLNHYSVAVVTPDTFTRYHRQFNVRLPSPHGRRGTWSADTSLAPDGVEHVGLSPRLDDNAQSPTGSLLDLTSLRLRCADATRREIATAAGSKYIPSLYVRRKVEAVLHGGLLSEDGFADLLNRSREGVYARAATRIAENEDSLKTKRRLLSETREKTVQERRADHEYRDELKAEVARLEGVVAKDLAAEGITSRILELKEELRGRGVDRKGLKDDVARLERETQQLRSLRDEVDADFDSVLEGGRPFDGERRPMIGLLYEKLARLTSLTKDDGPLEGVKYYAAPASAIVDRAGGGKTNLLCHTALGLAERQPVLFISGRTPLGDEAALVRFVARAMGWNEIVPVESFLHEVDEVLAGGGTRLIIFVDGINETRDISQMNKALESALNLFAGLRFQTIITCRDIYWSFFKDAPWTRHVVLHEGGQLYEFTEQEQQYAIEQYLKHFRIEVELGETAMDRCRHPLLLRFFCEAYTLPHDKVHAMGKVDEIRLKPLFDDYWENKVPKGRDSGASSAPSAEHSLFELTTAMLETSTAYVAKSDFESITGNAPGADRSSVYLALLDEDIVIEELPEDAHNRRVAFVYEEFMEYAAARALFMRDCDSVGQHISLLDKKSATFVNALGIAEYLCAFYLDAERWGDAFEITAHMVHHGGAWDAVVANVFQKNERALEMLEAVGSKRSEPVLKSVDALLNSLARTSRPSAIEVCALLGLQTLLPNVLTLGDLRRGRMPVLPRRASSPLESNPAVARRILRTLGQTMLDLATSGVQREVWRRVASGKCESEYDRRDVVRALWNRLGGSPRRSLLLAYAANGLFDRSLVVQKAAALVSLNSTNGVGLEVRKELLERATDPDLKDLLVRRSVWA